MKGMKRRRKEGEAGVDATDMGGVNLRVFAECAEYDGVELPI